MKHKRIIFMGTPSIAGEHLNILIKNNLNIVGVFTQPPRKKNRGMKIQESEVHKIAKKNNLEIFHPTKIDQSIIDQTKTLKPDLIIVIAYGIILPKNFLDIPKYGCINIHVSLLPRWRGATPIEHALLCGDQETGISIIQLSPYLDAGDILLQEKIKICDDIYSDELTQKLKDLGMKLIIKILPDIFQNKINIIKQDKINATYASKFTTEDRKIDFNAPIQKVFNHIRAHGPKPGSWFTYRGERIKILKAIKKNIHKNKGIILNKDFLIGCDGGSILPVLIQREGKKAVSLKEFLSGFSFNVNDQLNV